MSAMMRTTTFPASIVLQMLASGAISKRGGVLQERDVPADLFFDEMEKRGIKVQYAIEWPDETARNLTGSACAATSQTGSSAFSGHPLSHFKGRSFADTLVHSLLEAGCVISIECNLWRSWCCA
jgi:hypothetical protein